MLKENDQERRKQALSLFEWQGKFPGSLLAREDIEGLLNAYPSIMIKGIDGSVLPNVKERLGNEENLKKLKELTKEAPDKSAFAILRACQRGPITGYEITRFSRALGVSLGPGTLYPKLKKLMDAGFVERFKEVILYVTRDPSGEIYVAERVGYLTTEKGIRGPERLLGQFAPAPISA